VEADGDTRDGKVFLWDLSGLPGARPLAFRRTQSWYYSHSDFHPDGNWFVATTNRLMEVSFWPLTANSVEIVDDYTTLHRRSLAFTPSGRYLVTHWGYDRVRLWPLPDDKTQDVVDLKLPMRTKRMGLVVGPHSEQVLSTGFAGHTWLLSVTSGESLHLDGLWLDLVESGAISPSGKQVAIASMVSERQAGLCVRNLETGVRRVFDQPKTPGSEVFTTSLEFADESTLFTGGGNGLFRWDLDAETNEKILDPPPGGELRISMASDRRRMFVVEFGPSLKRIGVALHDLQTGDVRALSIPGEGKLTFSPDGTAWATGEIDGLIWVGLTEGGNAYVLAGHEGPVDSIAISPDNRWIASSGADKTLRLWPMPDLSKPPLHTLPHDELIAKLKTLTNLRAVRDPESSTGWKIEVGPFPGWAEVPEW
jgi:WD40 repeat protein